ncbi:MAG: YceI family protein [Bacteroidota bacterium]|jgi:polyisoprenoid-binding protein YceI
MNRLFTLIAIMLTLAGGLSAQTVWKADKVHSKVNFSVSHMVISEVTGDFKDFDATLTSSKDDFSDAVIDATIQMASVNTDNDKRDAHLKSDDFFNVEKFPTMTFKSTNIEKTGPGTFKITGNLTMRDVTKPVVLDTKLIGQTKTPWGATAAGFKATTVIDRFEFGTKWNKALETGGLIVGKDVTVTLLFEFDKQEQAQK